MTTAKLIVASATMMMAQRAAPVASQSFSINPQCKEEDAATWSRFCAPPACEVAFTTFCALQENTHCAEAFGAFCNKLSGKTEKYECLSDVVDPIIPTSTEIPLTPASEKESTTTTKPEVSSTASTTATAAEKTFAVDPIMPTEDPGKTFAVNPIMPTEDPGKTFAVNPIMPTEDATLPFTYVGVQPLEAGGKEVEEAASGGGRKLRGHHRAEGGEPAGHDVHPAHESQHHHGHHGHHGHHRHHGHHHVGARQPEDQQLAHHYGPHHSGTHVSRVAAEGVEGLVEADDFSIAGQCRLLASSMMIPGMSIQCSIDVLLHHCYYVTDNICFRDGMCVVTEMTALVLALERS